MKIREAKLLATEACHLCEHASREIESFNETMSEHGFMLEVAVIDIATDARMIEDYGRSIPVLIDSETGFELFWPFDAESIYNFLRACG